MSYKLFIINSLNNKDNEEKLEWINHMMSIIEKVNLWEDSDKEIYFILSNERDNLTKK